MRAFFSASVRCSVLIFLLVVQFDSVRLCFCRSLVVTYTIFNSSPLCCHSACSYFDLLLTKLAPQVRLQCGHWLCEQDAMALEKSEPAFACPFCDARITWRSHGRYVCFWVSPVLLLTAHVNPLLHSKTVDEYGLPGCPTAGIRVLCLDGGGVKGRVHAAILEYLERASGVPVGQ